MDCKYAAFTANIDPARVGPGDLTGFVRITPYPLPNSQSDFCMWILRAVKAEGDEFLETDPVSASLRPIERTPEGYMKTASGLLWIPQP